MRFEYDNRSAQEMKARTVLLFNLAKELKLLADIFKLSIVVVNQVFNVSKCVYCSRSLCYLSMYSVML